MTLANRFLMMLFGAAMLLPVPSRAEVNKCMYDDAPNQPPDANLPFFQLPRIHYGDVANFKALLKQGCFTDALVQFFGSGYSGRFPDWVVYIDGHGVVAHDVVKKGKHTSFLREENYIWVVVFSDTVFDPPTTKHESNLVYADTADIRFSRRTIAFRRDPTITLLIKGLAKVLTLEATTEAQPSDTSRALKLHEISDDSTKSPFYAAFGRVSIAENTQVELSVAPMPAKSLHVATGGIPEPVAYANVVNVRRHDFELGVLAGGTYGEPIRTYADNLQLKQASSRYAGNAYLTVVANVVWVPALWWEPSWQRTPVGVFAGTNVLRGTPGDEFLLGGVIGHVFSNAGLAAGADWLAEPTVAAGHVSLPRRHRLIAGIDLRF
jgi:hypothetical protein